MNHTRKPKKQSLWYNPAERGDVLREEDVVRLAADREGRALLESCCRLYRRKL